MIQGSTTICLNCGETIGKGRTDKKFCDEGCRNNYHNKQKIQSHNETKDIEHALKTNRKVLKHLHKPKKWEEVIVHKDVLLQSGFNFKYHTHHVITKKFKNEFIFCYDYGYMKVEDDKYRIIKSF